MDTNRTRGFSMVEVMIVLIVSGVFFLIAFETVMATVNVADIETTVVDMDTDANRMMQEATSILAPSFLPITRTAVTDLTDFQKSVINNPTVGFGQNGNGWLIALQNGTNFVPFANIVDRDNSGDGLDADLQPYLGVMRVGNIINNDPTDLRNKIPHIISYGLNGANNYDANFKLIGNINPGLARLTFADVSAVAQNQNFGADLAARIGANNPNAFGIIRFAPLHDAGGNPRVLSEAALNLDLDGDGNQTGTFLVGTLEVVYPEARIGTLAYNRVTYNIGGPMVLVNTNNRSPIFQLVRFDDGAGGTSNIRQAANGQYALRIRLLLCDFDAQQAKMFVSKDHIRAIPRYYETVVVLRNMAR